MISACKEKTHPIQFENGKTIHAFENYRARWLDAVRGKCDFPFEKGKITYYKVFDEKWCCDDFYDADKVTAFDVYKKICEIQLYKSFKDLAEGTKMQILEALYRMLQIDWTKIDHPGAEEI